MSTSPMAPRELSENTTLKSRSRSPMRGSSEPRCSRAHPFSRPGITTTSKTEILRAALGRNLTALEEETPRPAKPRKR